MDVFVYVIVLGLAVQFLPGVISEAFTMTLVTAVLLKLVLEAVLAVKSLLLARIRAASTVPRRIVSIGMLGLVLPGSKLLVLWLEQLLLGDAVSLGGFFAVTGLIIVLTLARFGVRRLLGGRQLPH